MNKDANGIFLHACEITTGTVAVGDAVSCAIDKDRRADIMRNHTAAHLLQAALREVLGTHVQQAGQLVSEDVCRFDFTHFSAMTAAELMDVEQLVNEKILDAIDVTSTEMSIEDAKKIGAMALFGEKYGDRVRVVQAGEFSKEFCGGTHVNNTSRIGLFKIRQEGSVAAGVRRIEAVTGKGVLRYLDNAIAMIGASAQILKINNPKEMVQSAQRIAETMQESRKEIEKLKEQLASMKMKTVLDSAVDANGVKVITAKFEGTAPDMLRKMSMNLTDAPDPIVAVLAAINDGKLTFVSGASKAAIEKGVKAGNVVRPVAQIAGGNGGGKPDIAMAGGKDLSKVDEAIAAVADIVKGMM